METRLAAKPSRYTRLLPKWPAKSVPSSEALTAVITCGRKSVPYWVADRSYASEAVRIVLAAGKVTRAMPWTSAAVLTVRFSAWVAISPAPHLIFDHECILLPPRGGWSRCLQFAHSRKYQCSAMFSRRNGGGREGRTRRFTGSTPTARDPPGRRQVELVVQVHRGIDQRQMGKRLREVTLLSARLPDLF